jgi:hypothetical protein
MKNFGGYLHELCGLSRGNPRKVKSSRFQADMFEQVLEESELASCVVITFQVMAVSGVSPGNPDPVGTMPESGQDEFGAYPGGAGYPNDPDVGRVLQAAYPGQIRCPVTAPVAKEGCYLGLPIVHRHLLPVVDFQFSVPHMLFPLRFCREPYALSLEPFSHFINHRHNLSFLKTFEVEGP